ncbi:GAR1, partial [Hepatospora eriocheir]
MFKKNYKKQSFTSDSIKMGKFVHQCENLGVIKLICKDIPYPNSPVLFSKKEIGKIDDVFGRVDDVYASIKLKDDSQANRYFVKDAIFDGYSAKFLSRTRFKSRTTVEKEKITKQKEEANKSFSKSKRQFNSK